MKNIRTEIVINATPSSIWKHLMDFNKYPQWNPFVHITGKAEVGSQLENSFFLEEQKPQVFRPVVLEVETEKAFRWEGSLFFKGLFDGEHYFLLESISDNQTRFVHGENFRGILSGLILNMIGEKTQQGFEKMNDALKQICEEVIVA
ncbi:MAG: SRPBCC domain-containing protein [Chitinophagales bacterium]